MSPAQVPGGDIDDEGHRGGGLEGRRGRREDPHPLTQYFLDHPVRASAWSGIAIVGVCLRADRSLAAAACVGAVGAAGQWLIWRVGGPGLRMRRYLLRRFPKR